MCSKHISENVPLVFCVFGVSRSGTALNAFFPFVLYCFSFGIVFGGPGGGFGGTGGGFLGSIESSGSTG